jgi:hypothetical protein
MQLQVHPTAASVQFLLLVKIETFTLTDLHREDRCQNIHLHEGLWKC